MGSGVLILNIVFENLKYTVSTSTESTVSISMK